MRLVLLVGTGPEQRYVANTLVAAYGDEVAAIVIADPPRQSLVTRTQRYLRRYTIPQLVSRLSAKAYARLTGRGARRARIYTERLFPRGDPGTFAQPDLVRRVPSHNGAACRALLAEIGPDVIAVFGTGVIKAPVIRLARRAILNLHTGLSPIYRGSDTIFWALHNEEPQHVGVTVHLLDEGVDTGAIIRTGRPVIAPDDDEDTLFCKAVVLGAPLYAEAIREVFAGGRTYAPQRLELGREYRFVDRTVAAERRVERLLRDGLLRRYAERAR
jgi:methionyl-tRNA formyltransferase